MARRTVQSESNVCPVFLETYAEKDCMNQLLLREKLWKQCGLETRPR